MPKLAAHHKSTIKKLLPLLLLIGIAIPLTLVASNQTATTKSLAAPITLDCPLTTVDQSVKNQYFNMDDKKRYEFLSGSYLSPEKVKGQMEARCKAMMEAEQSGKTGNDVVEAGKQAYGKYLQDNPRSLTENYTGIAHHRNKNVNQTVGNDPVKLMQAMDTTYAKLEEEVKKGNSGSALLDVAIPYYKQAYEGAVPAVSQPTSGGEGTGSGATPRQSSGSSSFACKPANFSDYTTKYGFNPANGTKQAYFDFSKAENKATFNTIKEKASKWAPVVGVDPTIAAWWVLYETAGKKDSFSYSNCGDKNNDVNHNCETTGSGQWQLGYGQQFATYTTLPAAFKAIYGNPNDPKVVQKVGQNVYDKAGQKKTFPEVTVEGLMDRYQQSKDSEAKYLISVLMRDQDISMYQLATALKSDANPTGSEKLKDKAFRWSPHYANTWQESSNLMNDIVTNWNGGSGAGSGNACTNTTAVSPRPTVNVPTAVVTPNPPGVPVTLTQKSQDAPAQVAANSTCDKSFKDSNKPACIQGATQLVANILYSVFGIGAFISFVFIIIGGFKFMTSQGDPKAVDSARNTITWAVGGLAAIVISYIILVIIASYTNLPELLLFKIPMPGQ